MTPWIKAGLIGGAALAALNLLGLIPCVGCVTWLVGLVLYVGIGVLAAYWIPPKRDAGHGAGQGAMGAGLAALIGGVVYAIAATVQAAIAGSARVLSQIPPEWLEQLRDAGLDESMLEMAVGVPGAALGGSLCCAGAVIVAAVLGALGGALLAAIKPD
jgi:hypothetical protein